MEETMKARRYGLSGVSVMLILLSVVALVSCAPPQTPVRGTTTSIAEARPSAGLAPVSTSAVPPPSSGPEPTGTPAEPRPTSGPGPSAPATGSPVLTPSAGPVSTSPTPSGPRPTLSPIMRQIAYVSPSGRTSTLVYVDQVAAAAQEEQFRAQFGPDMDVEVLDYSPNGRYIALGVGRKITPLVDRGGPSGDIVIVDGDGQVIGGMPSSIFLNWTPDGQGFFFAADAWEVGPLGLAYLDGREGKIFTDTYHIGEVAMSPDGRTIVYTEREYRREGLWRINVEGGEPALLFAGDNLGPIAWSPDGNWVAVKQPRPLEGLPALLWLVSFADREIFSLEAPGRPVWSPDSHVLALEKRRLSSDKGMPISLIYPESKQVHTIWFYPPEGTGGYSNLVWSPDGLQLAFILYSEPDADGRTTSDIWVINVDGSGLRRLTGDGRPKSQLRWIP